MTSQRAFATTTLFDGASGNVLIAGGTNAQGFYYKTADIFVAQTGTFQQQPVVMQAARAFHAATPLLGQGTVLLTGGFDGTNVLQATEVFVQQAINFSLASTLTEPHDFHTATRLPSGKAVVVGGGVTGTAALPGSGSVLTNSAIQAEILLLSNGETCNVDGECADGHCWRESKTAPTGMCCDRECGDICSSCLQTKKADGSANGICSVAMARRSSSSARTSPRPRARPVRPTTNVEKCEPYVCLSAAACRVACTQDVHCDERYWCGKPPLKPADPVDCQEDLQNGAACTRTEQCASGFCIDGVCCNNACGELCQACDVAGFIGSCVQVPSGPPRGDRGECAGAGGPCEGECRDSIGACTYDQSECGDSSCANGSRSFGKCSIEADGVCTPQVQSCGDWPRAPTDQLRPGGTLHRDRRLRRRRGVHRRDRRVRGRREPGSASRSTSSSRRTGPRPTARRSCATGCLNRCAVWSTTASPAVCDATGACIDPPADPPPPGRPCSAWAAARAGARPASSPCSGQMGARRRRRSTQGRWPDEGSKIVAATLAAVVFANVAIAQQPAGSAGKPAGSAPKLRRQRPPQQAAPSPQWRPRLPPPLRRQRPCRRYRRFPTRARRPPPALCLPCPRLPLRARGAPPPPKKTQPRSIPRPWPRTRPRPRRTSPRAFAPERRSVDRSAGRVRALA
jgi:hypothetical protein